MQVLLSLPHHAVVFILVYCPETAVCKQIFRLIRGSLLVMLCVKLVIQIGQLGKPYTKSLMRYTGCGRYCISWL